MKPMQVKIFYDGGHIPSERFESIITNLSNKVNAWLQDHPDIDVLQILADRGAAVEVRGKTLGIVGYGHIGSQLGVLAEGLGMRVIS